MVDGGGGALERDVARARAREAVRVAGVGATFGGGGGGLVCGGTVREVVRFAGGAVVTVVAAAGAAAAAALGLARFFGLGSAVYGAVAAGMFSLSKCSLWGLVSLAALARRCSMGFKGGRRADLFRFMPRV